MRVIVDANLVFSAILNTNGKIADLLINTDKLELIAPNFLRVEVKKYHTKLMKISKLSLEEVEEIEFQLEKNIKFISEELIDDWAWVKAFELTKGIDEKDTPYIAFCLFFDCKVWTGDKKLITGLAKKDFHELILTNELYEIIRIS